MNVTLLPKRAEARPSVWPYAALGGLQVLDVATTYVILRWFAQGLEEGNPITGAVFSTFSLALGCLLVLVFKMLAVYLFWTCQTRVRLASALYTAVVINNVLLLGLAALR